MVLLRVTLRANADRRRVKVNSVSMAIKLLLAVSALWFFAIAFMSYVHLTNLEPSVAIRSRQARASQEARNSFRRDELPPAARARKRREEALLCSRSRNISGHRRATTTKRPGELGSPVVLVNLTYRQRRLVEEGWERHAFNQYVSDLISPRRSLADFRDKECKDMEYDAADVPETSLVICFHNEAWSTLLRTVHSVLERTPSHLLREIILVDDFSDQSHLKMPLEDYMAQFIKVKIVRLGKREGLIRARLAGAAASTAPVITFLDSHCECLDGWLEPLLDRIRRNSTRVVCPVIDVINDDTFEYHGRDSNWVNIGGFDWDLQFHWRPVPERELKRRKHTWEPVRSPTMAGGLFAIDRAFFMKLGTYDDGFDIWGGENLELSFKTWMCGGTLEIVPCSHVGHVFRKRSPYRWRTGVNVLRRNAIRLAKVWMDDYAKYYYERIGYEVDDHGDVTSRVHLRETLGCKSFEWYVKNVYPELFVPGDALARGELRNSGAYGRSCMDQSSSKDELNKPVGMNSCHGRGGNQLWLLSKTGEIRRDSACLDYDGKKNVVLYACHGAKGNQHWKHDPKKGTIVHVLSKKCLAMAYNSWMVIVERCDGNARQHWKFQGYGNKTK
ncbi:putative polypeptide N-acetylgalactosaminyltransferase 9 [Ornithodoros turicata]|uniref:putative polypeptide N-acetylgalactosaminyltransferase 9 n=1 Tax=Ornithodoros turicata TaxID=34597 RepID=UPI0031398965